MIWLEKIRDARGRILSLKQVKLARLRKMQDEAPPGARYVSLQDIDDAEVEVKLAEIDLAEAEMRLKENPK